MRDFAALKGIIPGPLSVRECEVLAERAAATPARRALEVGHYLGLSTAVILDALPTACELVTIDHHEGDEWCPPTSADDFRANVAPCIGGRTFTFINADMCDALPAIDGRFGFVFYDADHTGEAVAEFWALAVDLLEPRCTLIFDDADWEDQSTLGDLAESAGFVSVRSEPFVRTDGDKADPLTYTLEIMERSA